MLNRIRSFFSPARYRTIFNLVMNFVMLRFYWVILRLIFPLLAPIYTRYRQIRHIFIRNDKYRGRVLFAGQCYYNAWYLSRELRKLGWRADVLNWDSNPGSQMFYHGEDFKLDYSTSTFGWVKHMFFYLKALARYDIFHFSNAYGLSFGPTISNTFSLFLLPPYAEIRLL